MLNEGSLNYIHISGRGICFDGNTKLCHLTPARFFTNPIACLFVEQSEFVDRLAAILSARSTKLHEIHELTPTQPIIDVLTAFLVAVIPVGRSPEPGNGPYLAS